MTILTLTPTPLTGDIVNYLPHGAYYGTAERVDLTAYWVFHYNEEFDNWLNTHVDEQHWCYGVMANSISIKPIERDEERAPREFIYIRFDLSQLTLAEIATLLQPTDAQWPYFKTLDSIEKDLTDYHFTRSKHPNIVYDTCNRHWIDFDSKIN